MKAEIRPALLVLADGTTFEGEAIGADPPGGVATGAVVTEDCKPDALYGGVPARHIRDLPPEAP